MKHMPSNSPVFFVEKRPVERTKHNQEVGLCIETAISLNEINECHLTHSMYKISTYIWLNVNGKM